MIGACRPELKIPIMQFEDEIAIDPLRHSVSHLPAHNRDNTLPPKCGILQLIASSGKDSSRFIPNEALCLWHVSYYTTSSLTNSNAYFFLSPFRCFSPTKVRWMKSKRDRLGPPVLVGNVFTSHAVSLLHFSGVFTEHFPVFNVPRRKAKAKMTDPTTTSLIGCMKHSNKVQTLFFDKQERLTKAPCYSN